MLGSSFSISGPNIVLNTIVAESLGRFADTLENADDFDGALHDLIRRVIREHRRIIFNGNSYSDEWKREAEKRGLLNLRTTPEALPCFVSPKNIALFTRHQIFTETEMRSRYEILLESYAKTLAIEAQTMLEMSRKEILPAVNAYVKDLTAAALAKQSFDRELGCVMERELLGRLSELEGGVYRRTELLEEQLRRLGELPSAKEQADFCAGALFAAMQELRAAADELESLTGKAYWPFPTYGELLFNI